MQKLLAHITTGASSPEMCEVCRSSGHDFAYLGGGFGDCCAPCSDLSLAPAGRSPPTLHEYQFFPRDDPRAMLINGCDGGVMTKPAGMVFPVKCPEKCSDLPANYNPLGLTLDGCFKATSSSRGSQSGSPVGSSVMGQALKRAVSSSGSALMDASIDYIREAHNGMPYGEGGLMMGKAEKILRYREKKKFRRYEKKIQYATRKAYAESRPRLNGRFTKKTREQITYAYNLDGFRMDWLYPFRDTTFMNN